MTKTLDQLIAEYEAATKAVHASYEATKPLREHAEKLTKYGDNLLDEEQPADGVSREEFEAAWAAVTAAAEATAPLREKLHQAQQEAERAMIEHPEYESGRP